MKFQKLLSLAVAILVALGVFLVVPTDITAAPAEIKVLKRTDLSPFYSVASNLSTIRGLEDDFSYPVVVSDAPFAYALNQELNQLLYDIAAEMAGFAATEPWYNPSISAQFYKRITKKTFSLAVFVTYAGTTGTYPYAERVFHYDRTTNQPITFDEVQRLNGRRQLMPYEINETLYQKGREFARIFNQTGDCCRTNMGDVFQASNLYLHYVAPDRALPFFQRKENRGSLAADIFMLISAGVYPDKMRIVNNRQLEEDMVNPAWRRAVDRLALDAKKDVLVLDITDLAIKNGTATTEHAAFGQQVYELLMGEGVSQYQHDFDTYPTDFDGDPTPAERQRLLLLLPRHRHDILFYTNGATSLDETDYATFHPPVAYGSPHCNLMSYTAWDVGKDHPVYKHPVTLLSDKGKQNLNFHGGNPKNVDVIEISSTDLIAKLRAPQGAAFTRLFLDEKLPGDLKGAFELVKFKMKDKDYAVANKQLEDLQDRILAEVKRDKDARVGAIVFQETFEDEAWLSLHTRVRLGSIAENLNFIIDKKTGKLVTEREILRRFDIAPDKLESYLTRSADFNFLGDFDTSVIPLGTGGDTRIGDYDFWLSGDGLLMASCKVTNDRGTAWQDFILQLPH